MVTPAATQSFNRFSNLWTVAQWNSSITESVNQGYAHKALLLFRQMKQNGLEPNNLTFPSVAKACSKLLNLKYSQIVHTHVVKSRFQADLFVQTSVVDMYVKCSQLGFAYNLFSRMPKRDVASWNSMILGFAQLGFVDRVVSLLCEMGIEGIRADSVTVIGLTHSALSLKDLKMLESIHSFGIKIGIDTDVSVSNTWIAAYAKCGEFGLAETVFDGIDKGLKTGVSWNSMIAGYAHFEQCSKAVGFFKKMLCGGFRADLSTILSLLSSCVQPEVLFHGKLIHAHGIQVGCDSDIQVINTLISMYSKCGDIGSARYLFDNMLGKTRVSWTAMIAGYAEKGDLDEAMTLFSAMEAVGEKPDLVTIISLMSGCGQTGALELGKWIDTYATANGLKDNLMVCNALIDVYAKCGSMDNARELFYTMPEKSLVSWTTLIAGCALNGEFKEALGLFFQMVELGLKPNHITFLAVLQACNHAGFLEKGWECFNLMTKVYKINPGLDHYSCMADLLGRKGRLKEAFEFIQNMPFKPDVGIWSVLLSACKIHQNVVIGECVAYHLFELEPQTAVPYVQMANIYASAGKWDRVAAIRTMMKCNKAMKSPGKSLVQVNGKTHEFTVEDRCHPEGLLIYETLENLALQMKE